MSPAANPEDNLFTYAEAAAKLQVDKRTVRRYVADGKLEKVKITRRNVFVTKASVRRLLRGYIPL